MGDGERRATRWAHGGGTVLTLLLLDTNVLIDAERTALDLDALIADDDEPAIAAITVAELGVGVEVATGRRKQARTAFLDDVVATLPIIDYDLDVARAHTRLLVAVRAAGRPRGAHDLLIAATALATGRIVVTSDRPGFDGLPGVTVRRPG
ncbi:MAG: PIN domain-containing protein [Ilumatobacteraceae bacterium]